MRLQDDIDFTTLTWVKQELDDTLKQAQQALEAYVEDTSDKSQMRFCASYLHQVQGTLRMVELYGAAMVVEEMERLALGLLDGQIKQAEDAYTVLMRGMVQLPDYLERLQSGHRDIPIVLLPLLNDLRACRGEKLLSETALFSPDLAAALPASATGASAPVAQALIATNGGRLRLAFQFGLLKWFKGEDVDGNLNRLIAIVDRVRGLCVQLDARRLWWVAAGALEAVLVKGIDASVALKLLAGRVDRELKRLIDGGEASFAATPPNDLTKGLLYYVAQSKGDSHRVTELRQVYRLDKLMPSEAELKHARGALSGHNRALLDTVGTAIKEDLLRVKDALDLHLRTGSGNFEELAPQGEALHRVADTLGMLGLGVPRRVVLDQKDVIDRIAQGKQSAEESTLLDIAGSLLYVESSLDDHIDRLGADQRQESIPSSGFELPQAEVRKILDATTKEASANLQQAKQDIVAFIESPWDHSKIEQIPRLLEEISGALRMLNLPEPAALLGGVVRFAEVELLRHRRVPSGDQLDLMADAIASIEFYLEAVKEGRRNRDKILDVTRRSLEALGYWPLPSEESAAEEALPQAEVVAAVAVPSASEFPSFGEGFTTERTATPEPEPIAPDLSLGTDAIAAPQTPVEAVDALIASFGESPLAVEPTVEHAPELSTHEMRSAVEIAPGDSLEALVIGESAPEAHAPSVQDLDGLRISNSDFAGPESAASQASDAELVVHFEPEALGEGALSELFDAETLQLPTHEGVVLDEVEMPHVSDTSHMPDLHLELEVADALDAPAPLQTHEPIAEVLFEVTPEPVLERAPPAPEPAPPVLESAPPRAPEQVLPIGMPQGLHVPDVGFHSVPSDEIDDEIREVFVEEVQDELDNLNRQYPAWKHDLVDAEKLKPVRRSFHTLKGSGRLVGALAIGEYAWKIENMLNRILDKTIQPTPAVLDLLDHAIAALPGMLSALKGEGQPSANIGAIMWVADQLVTGQEVWLPKSSPAPLVTADIRPTSEAGSWVHSVASADSDAEPTAIEASSAEPDSDLHPHAVLAQLPESTTNGDSAQADLIDAADATSEAASVSPLDVDPMLMEILSSEVSSHLTTIDDYLAQTSPDFAPPVTEELLRAVHTLNGALSMVDLPVLTRVVAPLEGYLKRLRARGLQPSPEGVQAIDESSRCIALVMSALEARVAAPDTDGLAARVIALRDDLPAPDHPYHGFGIHDAEDHRGEPELDSAVVESEPRPWYEADELEDELASDVAAATPGAAVAAEQAESPDEGEALEAVETLSLFDDEERSEFTLMTTSVSADSEPEPASALDSELAANDEVAASTDSAAADEVVELTAIFDALEDSSANQSTPALLDSQPEESSAPVAYVDEAASGANEVPFESNANVLVPATDVDVIEAAELADLSDLLPADSDLGEAVEIAGLLPVEPEATGESVQADAPADAAPDAQQAEWISTDGAGAEDAASVVESDLLFLLDDVADADSPLVEAQQIDELEYRSEDAPVDLSDLSSERHGLAAVDGDFSSNEVHSSEAMDVIADDAQVTEIQEPIEAVPASELSDAYGSDDPSITSDAVSETTELAEGAELAEATETAEPLDSVDLAELTEWVDAPEFVEAPEQVEASALDEATETGETTDFALLTGGIEEPLASPADAGSDGPSTTSESAAASAERPVASIRADIDPDGPLDLPDMDLELLDIFVEEGVDILDHADGMMVRLRDAPDDRESVASLQRDLHTLKGGARMAGLTPIGDLSHAMESLFEAIVHGQRSASRPAIEALERAFDRLHGMVQRVRARQAIALPEHTIARLEAIIEGRELPVSVPAVAVEAPASSPPAVTGDAPAADAAPESEQDESEPNVALAPVAPTRPQPAQRRTQLDDDEAVAKAAQQELIRVRADLLDNLVNFAGEVSIYRSRLEAQMGGFRFNLVEFEQTVSRLREQLRKLEMETEAQILSRFQRETEHSGNTEFDPLELDRFSTLQQLSRALAESVSDLVSIQNLLDDIARQSETLLLQQSRVSSDLQEGLMRTRMVPFESLVPRLRRILRQTAAELGKKAQLKVEGTQGEMDRTVLERMTAPFEHMLRNSLAHGIEAPQVRRAVGKPEEGAVSIKVAREATEVLIQVTDDGAGMNRDAIRRKAIERGLMTAEAQLSDRDIFQFVLEAGFSTASVVSKVAGRGVGMDVVASEVKQLGGSLEIDSDYGKGTRITIRLPFTLAVAQAVMVRLGDATHAIPMSSITGVTRMPRKEFDRRLEQKQLELLYGGETYQIYDLGDLLRSPVSHGIDETQVPLLMSKTGDQRAAVRVSQVIGSKEVVVKSAGAQLSVVPGIFGATIMGDGRVVVILDLAPLVRHGVALRQAPELAAELELLEPVPEPVARRQPLVMVVDDSITMRKVTTRVLERSNFDVFTAKDGLDAVEQLQDRIPDVILLDIEMPRMDGYEVATYIRNDPRLKHIPIIMITSRTGEKHRQRALEVGVDRYLGKPYQEADLLKNVQDALTVGHANVH